MSKTIQQLKDILQNKSGGKSVNKITNFNAMVGESLMEVMANVDLPSAKSTSILINDNYNDFSYYKLPVDCNLHKIIAITKRDGDSATQDENNYGFVSNRQLDVEREYFIDEKSQRFATTSIAGEQYLKIDEETPENTIIANCDQVLSSNGNWGINGTTNLTVSPYNKLSGTGSVSFDIQVGNLNNGIVMLDQSYTTDVSANDFIVFNVYIPNVSQVKGVKYDFGADNVNYYTKTFLVDIFGLPIKAGWNTFMIDLTNLTVGAGIPALTSIPYIKIDILSKDTSNTFTSILQGVLVDSIITGVNPYYELAYYTTNVIFDPINNAWKDTPTADTDILMITNDEFELLKNQIVSHFYEDLFNKSPNLKPNMSSLYANFKFNYPSDALIQMQEYTNIDNILC